MLVMGLGRFGGGLGVTRYLLDHGYRVTLCDTATPDMLRKPLAELGYHEHLEVRLGPHLPEYLAGVHSIIVNPAVPKPWENQFLQEAIRRGIRLTTEIELAYGLLNPKRVIAITGSAGKSTTSAMAYHILKSQNIPSVLGGNIGGSILNRAELLQDDTTAVLELSSAMIYWLWDRERVSVEAPAVVCVTSYMPNHIDWHGDEKHYQSMKQRLLDVVPPSSIAILPNELQHWASCTQANIHMIHDEDQVQGCSVPGRHNAMNAAFAVAAVDSLHPCHHGRESYEAAVRGFTGLPHRLNLCVSKPGIDFYNDSKSTTPEATCMAVSALESRVPKNKVHLIVGGYDKGVALTAIALLGQDLAGMYAIGSTSNNIVSQNPDYVTDCRTLENAMDVISSRIQPGDVVLLSPGCASWDQFSNYEERGERFIELAKNFNRAMPC